MNKARLLPFLSRTTYRSRLYKTAEGIGAIKYKNTRKHTFTGIKLYGDYVYSSALRRRVGIGVRGDDGSVRVAIRVHSDCYLDGYEFVRILKEKGSPAYQGEYDSEHFLYRVTEETTQLLGELDFAPGVLGYTLTFEAIVPETKADIEDFGLQFVSDYGSKYVAKRNNTGAGPSTFTVKIGAGIAFNKMQQAGQGEAFDIPIRYDSFKFYTGSVVPGRYKGVTRVIDIKEPLHYAYLAGKEVCDELDVIKGKITRKISKFIIDESTPINKASYDEIPVFAIPVPSDIKYPSMDCDTYYELNDPYDMPDEPDSFYIPEGDGNMYVFIDEDTLTVDEARKRLIGHTFYYQGDDRIEQIEKLYLSVDGGVVVVEACANERPEMEVNYYE